MKTLKKHKTVLTISIILITLAILIYTEKIVIGVTQL